MDRRLFNADGSLRDNVVIEEAPAPTPPPQFSAADITGAAARPMAAPPPAPQFLAEASGAEPEQTEFTEFLMRIASEAFIYLGLVPHPMTGRAETDLGAAKEAIDMLLMLRGKTQGNLTPGETSFYDDLLADLKMQFVSMRQR